MRGKFISLEGGEGAGKSTAMQFIRDYMQQAHKEVVWTREPGGTPLAEEIRATLLHPLENEKMYADTELLLMFAARAQHMQEVIIPALQAGHWVLSDRFIDASYAYQGSGREVNQQMLTALDEWIVGDYYPNLTLLLDIPPKQGLERAKQRQQEQDRIEQEKIIFFERVRTGYLQRAQQDPQRIKVIDASQPLPMVEQQIRSILDAFMARLSA